MSETIKMPNGTPVDKIKKYKWTSQGGFGEPRNIPKELLKVDFRYQRVPTLEKIQVIQSNFNRCAFGRINVSERQNGDLYVFDGWHRVCAARSRSDMAEIPCDVYHFDTFEEEAQAFIDCNINRRPVPVIAKFNAGLEAKNKDALYINDVLGKCGIRLMKSHAKTPRSFKSIGKCYQMARENTDAFEDTMWVISELCELDPINEKLIGGLYFLAKNLKVGIRDEKFRERVIKLGATKLTHAAITAAFELRKGGDKVWGLGILAAVNKNLKYRYKLNGEDA